jgi:hypothetical protein
LRFLGQLEHGLYEDFENVDPDMLQQGYGCHGHPRSHLPGQSGAGHPPDELDDGGGDGALNQIRVGQEENVHHDPVDVPHNSSPFYGEAREVFLDALKQSTQSNIVPEDFGLLPTEWEDGHYPAYESIRTGVKRRKELRIPLPHEIWFPRAAQWGRALFLMSRLQNLQPE